MNTLLYRCSPRGCWMTVGGCAAVHDATVEAESKRAKARFIGMVGATPADAVCRECVGVVERRKQGIEPEPKYSPYEVSPLGQKQKHKVYRRIARETEFGEAVCPTCKLTFKRVNKQHIYCSELCGDRNRERRVGTSVGQCAWCRKPIQIKSHLHRFCSDRCRWLSQEDQRKRERQASRKTAGLSHPAEPV
jgi:predicted nucleic acid-binding Zn ribbon protein